MQETAPDWTLIALILILAILPTLPFPIVLILSAVGVPLLGLTLWMF
jgi:hypothetical protein